MSASLSRRSHNAVTAASKGRGSAGKAWSAASLATPEARFRGGGRNRASQRLSTSSPLRSHAEKQPITRENQPFGWPYPHHRAGLRRAILSSLYLYSILPFHPFVFLDCEQDFSRGCDSVGHHACCFSYDYCCYAIISSTRLPVLRASLVPASLSPARLHGEANGPVQADTSMPVAGRHDARVAVPATPPARSNDHVPRARNIPSPARPMPELWARPWLSRPFGPS